MMQSATGLVLVWPCQASSPVIRQARRHYDTHGAEHRRSAATRRNGSMFSSFKFHFDVMVRHAGVATVAFCSKGGGGGGCRPKIPLVVFFFVWGAGGRVGGSVGVGGGGAGGGEGLNRNCSACFSMANSKPSRSVHQIT